MLSFILNRNPSIGKPFLRIFLYCNIHTIGGQDFADSLRPFDQAYAVSIKIFISPDLLHFLRFFDPIYVKVIQWQAPVRIFLYDGKRRTVYIIADSKPCRKSLRKNSLTRAEIARLKAEGENA